MSGCFGGCRLIVVGTIDAERWVDSEVGKTERYREQGGGGMGGDEEEKVSNGEVPRWSRRVNIG